MRFYDTRDVASRYSLNEVAKMGLAPSGGLFMPEAIPTVDMDKVMALAEEGFSQMAYYIVSLYFDDVEPEVLRSVVEDAFDFPVTMTSFGALELFNGPTLAFKDFGARFMARMLAVLSDRDMTILTATSGDTGSAVANGFHNIDGVRVVVLYPDGRVSDFQERQMTTLGGNITPLAVQGSFDDCQMLCKKVLGDRGYCEQKGITSANSISILRWIPQSFYYFYGYYLYKKAGGKGEPCVTVPSGNFGNITSGILAKLMGLPISRFVAATNENDTIVRFLESGYYSPKPSVQTISNAMDVGDPSNYERLVALFKGDIEAIRYLLSATSYSDAQTKAAIKDIYDKYQYISDPHSAIGYAAHKEGAGFYLSTAHYSKFEAVIEDVLGVKVDYPDKMRPFFEKEKVFTRIPVDVEVVKQFL